MKIISRDSMKPRGGYYKSTAVFIYNENKITKMLSEWFWVNDIIKLQVKSKAHGHLVKFVTTTNALHIAELLKTDPRNVKFSFTAGCACGCSPGYKVKAPRPGEHIYVEIESSEAEIRHLDIMMKSEWLAKLLAKDREAHAQKMAEQEALKKLDLSSDLC